MIDTELDAQAREAVERHDTDRLHKLPTDTMGNLQAWAFGPPHNDPADIFQCASDDARFVAAVQLALKARGRFMLPGGDPIANGFAVAAYNSACSDIARLVLELADALTYTPAEEALQRAYDDAHPDNSTEQDDWRQRARDLRATA